MSSPFIEIDVYSKHGHNIIMYNQVLVTAFYSIQGFLASLDV
jgi:hypothetical protein